MKCEKVQDLFSGYLENEMDTTQTAAFEQHLAECQSCRAAFDHFNAAVMMLDEMPEVELPVNFHATVMARVEQARRAAPQKVQWWKVDWQHVFTIRVPARAAAMGLAVALLLALIVQLTPVGPMAANFLGLQKSAEVEIQGVNPDEPNVCILQSPSKSDRSGLSICVNAKTDGAYVIQLGSNSRDSIAYNFDVNGERYEGSVTQNQGSIIQAPVARSENSTVAKLVWSRAGDTFSRIIFLPSSFDKNASAKKRSLQFQNVTVKEMLRGISEKYGIVIIASGNMSRLVGYSEVKNGSPREALYNCLDGLDLNSGALTDSIYEVEPLR